MLSNSISLLAISLLAALSQVTSGSLYSLCWSTSDRLELVSGYGQEDLAYKVAIDILSKKSGLFSTSPKKLIELWTTVRSDECDEAKVDHVLKLLSQCEPSRHHYMKNNLLLEARKYITKCVKSSFWDDKVNQSLEAVTTKNLDYMSVMLGDQFKDFYVREKDHYIERLHFRLRSNNNCCEPQRAPKAVFKMLAEQTKTNSDMSPADYYRTHPEELKVELKKRLFDPCRNYLHALKPMMRVAEEASNIVRGDDVVLADIFTEKFEKTLFRFKYCQNLHEEPQTKTLIDYIKQNLKNNVI